MPPTEPPAKPATATITPLFPLLLLETMRDMDRPEEVLEGEDVSVSMPRRLGLSDVVFTQIHRFREEQKRKRLQTPATVEDLIRLVIRRPDAESIFREAGRRLAAHAWEQRSRVARLRIRFYPAGLAMRSAGKAARALFQKTVGDSAFRVSGRPVGARIDDALTVRADPTGAACAFYTGLLGETVSLYSRRPHAAAHDRCAARGAPACEWSSLVLS